MRFVGRLLACCGVPLVLAGCNVYDPSLLDHDSGPPPPACELRHPPDRPPGADDGMDIGELTFTVKDVIFDQSGERWRDMGFDLDGLCTLAPEFQSECRPPAATASPKVDGNNGIDNSFGSDLFPTLDLAVPGLEMTSREYQVRGVGAVAIRIRDWNGEDDDPHVDVTMAVTVIGAAAAMDGSAPAVVFTPGAPPELADGSPVPLPLWDGTDYMWLRDDNFFEGDLERPLIRDSNAYIAGRRLVVSLPDRTDFVFPGMDIGLLVRLTAAVAVVRISADNTQLDQINMGGRWPVLDLLSTAESMGVCRGTDYYILLGNQLDRIVDLRARPGSGGPMVDCDALSLGLGFLEGHRVEVAAVAPGPPLEDACAAMMDGGVPADSGM